MNIVDMTIDKVLYKKIDSTITSADKIEKIFIDTSTPLTAEVEVGTFLFKVGGTARIYVRGYSLSEGISLIAKLYDGGTLLVTNSDYASSGTNAEVEWNQEVQAFKKYTLKVSTSSVSSTGKVDRANVSTYLHDNTEMYLI